MTALLCGAMLINGLSGSRGSLQLQNTLNEDDIARSSRQAIIETGMSDHHFDEHITLVKVVNKPGDLRVLWKYSLDSYAVTLNDSIGFYTTGNHKQVYVHSIKDILRSTHDIKRTISRSRATRLMTSCIGKHAGDTVVFLKLSDSTYSTFYLTAHSLTSARTRDDRERSRKGGDETSRASGGRDTLESEDIQKPLKVGYINLETGRCTQGEAVVAP